MANVMMRRATWVVAWCVGVLDGWAHRLHPAGLPPLCFAYDWLLEVKHGYDPADEDEAPEEAGEGS